MVRQPAVMPYSTFHFPGENSTMGFGSTQKKIGKQLNYYQNRGKLLKNFLLLIFCKVANFNQENISNFFECRGN